MSKPIGVELFCGVGGMTLGFERAGFNVAGAFDFDCRSVEYHSLNFPHSQTFQRDVATLSAAEVVELCQLKDAHIDVLFGGPPCQGFSEIGRKYDGDERNLLILEFARLVRDLKPQYFVVENVRGLLYDYSKCILTKFVRSIRRSGYQIVEPIRLLDASNYGVPQRRRRAFILGYLRELRPPEYPKGYAEGAHSPPPTVSDAIGDLPDITCIDELLVNDFYNGPLGKPSTYAQQLRSSAQQRAHAGIATGLTGCLRTVHSDETVARFSATTPGTYEPKSRCYRLKADGVAFTLRAGSDPNNGSFTAARPIHPAQPRCITTREAARLHSFPDWFQFHPTKWHGFRQVGNSVPPMLAQAVASEIYKAIQLNVASPKLGPKLPRRVRKAG